MSDDFTMTPEVKLLTGVAFGNTDSIREAHAEGIDLNACFENGHTPLTDAILGGMGEPDAVRALLELGADPNRKDAKGNTPWLACLSRLDDRVVEEEQREIKAILEEAGASREGEEQFELYELARKGDLDGVLRLLDKGASPVFPPLCPLGAALHHPAVAKLLLERGAHPEGSNVDEEGMSCLMHAAHDGDFEMVKLLVQHGADINRGLPDAPNYTAIDYARDREHDAIADWLAEQAGTPDKGGIPAKARTGGAHEKFTGLYRQRTAGPNYDLDTEAIATRLAQWDGKYGIHVVDIGHDRLTVQFEKLPDDLDAFTREIAEFCPDIIHQNFGVMDEIVEQYGETGRPLPDDLRQFVDGIDFDSDDWEYRLLARWLKQHQAVELWWD